MDCSSVGLLRADEKHTGSGIERLFYPRGVAVIGSTSEGKIGYHLIGQILEGGYPHVFAVNPRAQGAFSVSGYDSVITIERPVDLAVIASPAATVPAVLEDCGRAGVAAAVVISAGFSEVGNVTGEDEIRRVAEAHDIRIVGPNCAGIINTHYHLFASLETRPPTGEVAFISQSGALGGAVLSWAEEQGLGFSKFVSTGNRVDLDEIELLRWLAHDSQTQVAAVYIESVADGRGFMEAVQAFTREKPLVVIKSGRSQSGQRATLSHTGSMAGADAVYDAALRQSGALRVETVEEMFDLCKGLAHVPPVNGRRIAIVTNSGGPGVLAADRAEAEGLQVPEPSDGLQRKLAAMLPPHIAPRNPFDLTVEGTEEGYRETLCAVLTEVDAALALNVATPYLDSVALARGACDAAQAMGKPVVANFMAGHVVREAIAYLRDRGVPNYPTGERAVTVLARMATYEAEKGSIRPLPPIPEKRSHLPGDGKMLEPQAMAWLAGKGIPVPEFRFATSCADAVQGSRQIGYPVVMKVVAPDIIHKSDRNGVILGVETDEAAEQAFHAIRRAAEGADFRGVVVYPSVHDAHEVLVGLKRDAQFGPVVVFGLGGIYTEVWRDIVLRVAPLDRTEAEAMIREVQAYPILRGIRGRRSSDLGALADLLVQCSRLPFHYPELVEVDLNPVFLLPEKVLVGDVRVITQ